MQTGNRRQRSALQGAVRVMKRGIRNLVIPPLRSYFRYLPSPFAKKFLWNYVADHLWWLEAKVKAKTVLGSTLFVDARDIVGRYIYYFGLWEPNLTDWIRERLLPGDVFVDVGANIGYYSLLASTLVGEAGKVVAIEPLPEIFGTLRINLEVNQARNVRAVNVAAWDVTDTVDIFTWPKTPPGYTSLMPGWADLWHLEKQGQVPAEPLSVILRTDETKAIRMIKVDVEGTEWRVISGMKSLLGICRTDLEVIVELTPSVLVKEGTSWQKLLNSFRAWGFHPYRIENSYSAEAYFSLRTPSRPKRIDPSSVQRIDQMDVIFSRIDAVSL